MRYSLGHDIMFVILVLIAALMLINKLGILAFIFSITALVYVQLEHKITEYWEGI